MTEKYGIEEYLKEYEEILNEKEPVRGATVKPNILQKLKAQGGLNKVKNERIQP